jgi:hypothetical protein
MNCCTRHEEEYYVASARCREVKFYNGHIAAHEDEVVWLGISDGYPSCGPRGSAHHFKDIKDIVAKNWDGMPWWNRLKPGSLRIYHVYDVVIKEYREEEVNLDGTKVS